MDIKNILKKKDKIPQCAAVIVAAGSSQRMGADKVAAYLGDMPVLARTLLAFQRSEYISEIIVVTKMEKLGEVASLCQSYGIKKCSKVICGGETRTASVLAGVSEVSCGIKRVAIHDGARPMVTLELIERTVHASEKYLAVVPVVRSTDTLKQTDEKGLVTSDVDRELTVRVQTPQVFETDLIKGALTAAVNKNLALTDDSTAVERMGVRTFTVEGDEDNIKLTRPRDMYIAAAILKDRGDYIANRAGV